MQIIPRTVPEMNQVLAELKKIVAFRKSILGEKASNILGVCLSARRNMCIHKDSEDDYANVDAICRSKTAPWIRKNAREGYQVQ